MISVNYGCSQPDLYNASRSAWKLCQKNLAAFTAFSPRYSDAFIAQNQAAVDAADLLLDYAARKAKAQSARVDLLSAKDELIYKYGFLTAYIKKAFEPSKQEFMLAASGEGYLAKTKTNNWSSASSLISSAVPFLDEYVATLTNNENMPPSFVATFKAVAKDFNDKYAISQNADANVGEETDTKLIANNALYNAVRTMLEDAQSIFRRDVTLAKQFVWSTIVAQTHGIKNAGVNGKITADNNKNGIANVLVAAVGTDKTTTSDTEGRYDLSPLSNGTYTLTFSCNGFESKTIENIMVNTGVTTRQHVSLSPKVTLLIA